jgi:hemerythrin-like domain-containing protein
MHNEFFNIIHHDHVKLMGLINQLKETSNRAFAQRDELFNKMKSELLPHMRGEEKAFYPPLQQSKDTKEDAMEALEEHHIAEVSLMELDKLSKQDEFWMPKLMVFKELISHHIDEEESKIFEDARKTLSEEQMRGVIREFQDEKEKVKGKAIAAKR